LEENQGALQGPLGGQDGLKESSAS